MVGSPGRSIGHRQRVSFQSLRPGYAEGLEHAAVVMECIVYHESRDEDVYSRTQTRSGYISPRRKCSVMRDCWTLRSCERPKTSQMKVISKQNVNKS